MEQIAELKMEYERNLQICRKRLEQLRENKKENEQKKEKLREEMRILKAKDQEISEEEDEMNQLIVDITDTLNKKLLEIRHAAESVPLPTATTTGTPTTTTKKSVKKPRKRSISPSSTRPPNKKPETAAVVDDDDSDTADDSKDEKPGEDDAELVEPITLLGPLWSRIQIREVLMFRLPDDYPMSRVSKRIRVSLGYCNKIRRGKARDVSEAIRMKFTKLFEILGLKPTEFDEDEV